MKTNYFFKARWLQGVASAIGSTNKRENTEKTTVQSAFALDSLACRLRVWPLKIVAVLAILLTLGIGNAWGGSPQEITPATSGWSTTAGAQSGTVGDITVTATNGVYNTQMRVYASATCTVSCSAGNISQIVFTTSSGNFTTSNVGTYTTSTKTWTGSATSVTFSNTSQVRVTKITVTYAAAAGPAITVSATSLTEVGYSTADFTQQVKSFTVSGSNLKANVTVTAPDNYEVCKTSGGTYASSVSFDKGSGTLSSSTVYVRLKSGKAAGNYSGDVSCTSTDATTKTVGLSGSVPYTITWSANESTFATTYVAVGSTLALPASDPNPSTFSCTGKSFYGWYGAASSYSHASVAPSIAADGDAVSADKTYYAVFGTLTGGGASGWLLCSTTDDVTAGTYVITWNNSYYLPSETAMTTPNVGSGITVSNDKLSNTVTSAMQWTFTGDNTNGFAISHTSGSTYKLSATNTAQGISVTTGSTDRKWTVSVDGTYGMLLHGDDGGSRNLAVYNSATWRYYSTGASYTGTLRLYKYSSGGTWSDYATSCSAPSQCATPTFSVSGGTYSNDQSVTLNCATDGATIYYTMSTNGVDPSDPTSSSTQYSSAITVDHDNTIIKAIAIKGGMTDSEVASATYTLKCAAPTFSVAAGTYTSTQSVALSSTTISAFIHYTTDGSDPTGSSPTYSTAISVSEGMTIKAIATKTNYDNSDEASATYRILDCDWYESFDNANGSGGNDGVWSGSIGSNAFTPDKTGWTFSTTNCGASKCIKLGTTGAAGSAQTAALTGMRGTISVKFSAAGFGTDGDSDGKGHYTHDLTISSTNGTPSPSSVTITNQTWEDYDVEITGVTADAQITIASSGNNRRFFLDEVCIKNSGVQYSVTYDDNDATSGSVPTDGNKYDRNGSATVLGNTGNLVKTGWTFAGWNTAADGSGTTYAAGSTYSNITSNVTLYAKWTCTVTWSVNENTSACSPETVTYDPDGCKVTTVPRPDPEDYCGDKFVGWYTTDYDDDDTAPTGTFKNVEGSPDINDTGSTTFYAVFADFAE